MRRLICDWFAEQMVALIMNHSILKRLEKMSQTELLELIDWAIDRVAANVVNGAFSDEARLINLVAVQERVGGRIDGHVRDAERVAAGWCRCGGGGGERGPMS
jgi:hypothetical protein